MRMQVSKPLLIVIVTSLQLLLSGCATYTTISEAQRGTAKVFSGTRLDIKAIRGDRLPTKAFKSKPPSHPALDLPFSLAMDVFIFPMTSSAVIYESVFE